MDHCLRKVQVTAVCHADEKMPDALVISIADRLGDIGFQLQTARVLFIFAPGQLCLTVSGEAACIQNLCHERTSPEANDISLL